MQARFMPVGMLVLVIAASLCLRPAAPGQDTSTGQPALSAPAPDSQAPAASAAELPQVPKGVEVLARGPVHEAFATPTGEPEPTKPVAKKPPTPLEEMPPAEKPEGNVTWIAGYWAWDDDRNDYLWVSGIWRTAPPSKRWVAGYWKEDGKQWRWAPGFWTATQEQNAATTQQVTYLPAPPKPPEVASPGEAPTPDSFYVPGAWVWHDAGYVSLGGTPNTTVWREAGYSWTAGYWGHMQRGYVWVPAHYRWTPGGYLFIPGYWDLTVADRGVLYAPVVVDVAVVGPGYVYTPAYVVRDTVVIDAMFVRPCYCHYYFGDYYGPIYRERGYESCIVYSRRHYDAIFVYERYEHRDDPRWETVQIDVCLARHAGRAPCPPRTLVQQNTIIQQNITVVNHTTVNNTTVNNFNNTTVNKTTVNNNQVLVPSSQLSAAKGIRTVPLDNSTRLQARQQAQVVQQVAMQRSQAEIPTPAGRLVQPRTATLNVPTTKPVISHLETARPSPTVRSATSATANSALSARPGNNFQGSHPGQAGPASSLQRPATPTMSSHPPTQFMRPTTPARQPQRPLPPKKPTPDKRPTSNDGHS